MLSVPPEAVANAAFQAAPSRLTRHDASPANNFFGTLVHQNAPNDLPPAAPPASSHQPSQEGPPPSLPRRADPPPAANNNSPHQQTNTDSSNATSGGDSASTEANAATTSGNGNSQTAGSTSEPTDAPSSSDPARSPAPKSQDAQGETDAAPIDPLLAQQLGLVTTTPTPVAVAVPVSVTTSPAPASSADSAAPLAIAAAAIAASSQAVQVKSGSDTIGSATSDAATTKTTPSPQSGVAKVGTQIALQSNGADPSVVTTAALTGTASTSAPFGPKAQAKSSATTSTSGGPTADSTAADSSSAGTTTPVGPNAGASQAANGGKPETPASVTEPTIGAGQDAAASTPPAAAHDHPTVANSIHASADLPDPGAQAVTSVQPQLNSTASLGQANNLTVTAASNGPVPVSGVALQIAVNVKSGKTNFEIRLDPPELGRIDVRVQIDQNGQLTSHLTVEKPETLSLLRQDAPQLQQALNDAGLKTDGGGLQFSLRDHSSSGQHGRSENNPNAQQLIISDEHAVPAAIAGRSYGRAFGSSSVDIRV